MPFVNKCQLLPVVIPSKLLNDWYLHLIDLNFKYITPIINHRNKSRVSVAAQRIFLQFEINPLYEKIHRERTP